MFPAMPCPRSHLRRLRSSVLAFQLAIGSSTILTSELPLCLPLCLLALHTTASTRTIPLGRGAVTTTAMPPKQKRAKKQAAAAVAPQAGRAASTAGLKHGQHRAKLLEAFDFEVSQGLKARLQGWRSKSVVFKHRYDEAGISVSELFARSIRMFGPREQDTALATDQALVELSKAGLPLIALDVIRRFLGERLAMSIVDNHKIFERKSDMSKVRTSSVNSSSTLFSCSIHACIIDLIVFFLQV